MKDATVGQALTVTRVVPLFQLRNLEMLRKVSFDGMAMEVRLSLGVTLTVTLAENKETKKLAFKDAVFSVLDGRNKFVISMKTVKGAKKKEDKKKLVGWMSGLKKFMQARAPKGTLPRS